MKLFQQLLVAPAALGLLAPLSASASEVNLDAISNYSENNLEIEDCIKFAGVCGLLTCLGEGAIEQQPYYEKVNKFLGSLIS